MVYQAEVCSSQYWSWDSCTAVCVCHRPGEGVLAASKVPTLAACSLGRRWEDWKGESAVSSVDKRGQSDPFIRHPCRKCSQDLVPSCRPGLWVLLHAGWTLHMDFGRNSNTWALAVLQWSLWACRHTPGSWLHQPGHGDCFSALVGPAFPWWDLQLLSMDAKHSRCLEIRFSLLTVVPSMQGQWLEAHQEQHWGEKLTWARALSQLLCRTCVQCQGHVYSPSVWFLTANIGMSAA